MSVLWHIELSHYNEKARWALDYKGVPYERRLPMPADSDESARTAILAYARYRGTYAGTSPVSA